MKIVLLQISLTAALAPRPHLLKLLHQLSEKLTQRRQVKHSWLPSLVPGDAGDPIRGEYWACFGRKDR
jgi:hypothetical protein